MRAFRILFVRYIRDTLRMPISLFFNIAIAVFLLMVFSGTFSKSMGPRYSLVVLPLSLLAVAFSAASSVSGSLVADFTSGYIHRLLATPCNIWMIVAAPLMANLIFIFIYGSLLILLASKLSGAAAPSLSAGGVLLCLFLATLWGFSLGALAIAFGIMGRSPQIAQLASTAAFYPLVYLSPTFLPPEMLEPWLATVSWFNPTTYIVIAMRTSLLGGWTWTIIMQGIAMSILLSGALLFVATRTISYALRAK